MPRFRVVIREVIFSEAYIEATDYGEARELAAQDDIDFQELDGREWYVETIEEVSS